MSSMYDYRDLQLCTSSTSWQAHHPLTCAQICGCYCSNVKLQLKADGAMKPYASVAASTGAQQLQAKMQEGQRLAAAVAWHRDDKAIVPSPLV